MFLCVCKQTLCKLYGYIYTLREFKSELAYLQLTHRWVGTLAELHFWEIRNFENKDMTRTEKVKSHGDI